jgi:hypothetical protein
VSPDETCAVCGRTILAGERTRRYVSASGDRDVCELCAARAERLGWQREEEGMPAAPAMPEKRRWRGLGVLLRRRPSGVPAPEAEPEREEEEEAPPEPTASSPDPAAPGARPARLESEPSLLSPFERAVARFNGSEASRTVAGLVRTLGPPWVSVGAAGGAPKEVRITVAWELSWYQWGVDLGDELRPIFQLDKGLELEQLDTAARQWNASAGEGGRIVLVAPAARRSSADGEPAAR